MAYNVTSLITKVQNKLDDSAFDSGLVTQFLNDTNRFVMNTIRWPFMETTQDFTAVIGQQSVGTLPTNYQSALDLRLIAPNNSARYLPYMIYEQYDRAYPNPAGVTNSTPLLWTVFGSSILVFPAPEQAYTIEMRYLKKPTELAVGTDVPDVPSDFEEIMVLGAYKRALEHEDNFDQAQVIGQQFDELVASMSQRLTQRQIGTMTAMPSRRSRSVDLSR